MRSWSSSESEETEESAQDYRNRYPTKDGTRLTWLSKDLSWRAETADGRRKLFSVRKYGLNDSVRLARRWCEGLREAYHPAQTHFLESTASDSDSSSGPCSSLVYLDSVGAWRGSWPVKGEVLSRLFTTREHGQYAYDQAVRWLSRVRKVAAQAGSSGFLEAAVCADKDRLPRNTAAKRAVRSSAERPTQPSSHVPLRSSTGEPRRSRAATKKRQGRPRHLFYESSERSSDCPERASGSKNQSSSKRPRVLDDRDIIQPLWQKPRRQPTPAVQAISYSPSSNGSPVWSSPDALWSLTEVTQESAPEDESLGTTRNFVKSEPPLEALPLEPVPLGITRNWRSPSLGTCWTASLMHNGVREVHFFYECDLGRVALDIAVEWRDSFSGEDSRVSKWSTWCPAEQVFKVERHGGCRTFDPRFFGSFDKAREEAETFAIQMDKSLSANKEDVASVAVHSETESSFSSFGRAATT
ncbi:MAG: hypothetical protein KVP17_003640 [Porospora cf. gigantea B]|uniref:uncharacterized protein n=1 Tax=Porospora cf. gigantea B TaxID=2853592 RepID=UPI003571CCAF|nr:MAG: hypothetical protein KVP17_003640 [Porospora cf. gigantea B]